MDILDIKCIVYSISFGCMGLGLILGAIGLLYKMRKEARGKGG